MRYLSCFGARIRLARRVKGTPCVEWWFPHVLAATTKPIRPPSSRSQGPHICAFRQARVAGSLAKHPHCTRLRLVQYRQTGPGVPAITQRSAATTPSDRTGRRGRASGRWHELGDTCGSLRADSLCIEATFLPDHARPAARSPQPTALTRGKHHRRWGVARWLRWVSPGGRRMVRCKAGHVGVVLIQRQQNARGGGAVPPPNPKKILRL
jgi:hypothetical protein